jgi:hypothetical protein
MRLFTPINSGSDRLRRNLISTDASLPIALETLPAPLPVSKVHPDQLIEDILIATLRRVQDNASPEVAAAASRYISLLSESAL